MEMQQNEFNMLDTFAKMNLTPTDAKTMVYESFIDKIWFNNHFNISTNYNVLYSNGDIFATNIDNFINKTEIVFKSFPVGIMYQIMFKNNEPSATPKWDDTNSPDGCFTLVYDNNNINELYWHIDNVVWHHNLCDVMHKDNDFILWI